jgi:hypothetical protein
LQLLLKWLHRVEDQPLNYTSLSDFWGTKQLNATRTSTLNKHLNGIKISSLRQSIQDGVAVIQKLCLQYPWIDSLWITQHLEEDKMNEIGRMEFIYSTAAYVTILANCASDCNSNFLQLRK